MPATRTEPALPPEAAALFRRGRINAAIARALGPRLGGAGLPVDFFAVMFPTDSSRQDLEDSNAACERSLKPHRAAFRRARARLSRRLGPAGRRGEGAALIAYCDLALGDYEGALKLARRAAVSAPSSYWLHLLHAAALWFDAGKRRSRDGLPEALEAADKALACRKDDPRGFMLRAGIKRELEDLAGHLADVERALALRPDFVWALAEKAENLGERGHYRRALGALNRLLALKPEAGWAWVHRARLRAFHGFQDLAMKDFDRAVTLDPECGPIYAWRGEARRRQGDTKGALEDLERAQRLSPAYRFPHLWKGRIQLLRGDYAGAAASFTRTLELEPREQLAASWRAEAWWKLGRTREAALGFDAVYPAEPNLAWNLLLEEGQSQEPSFMGKGSARAAREAALRADLDRVVGERPRDPWALAFRGRCRIALGDLKSAAGDLALAAELGPGLAYPSKWLGECRLRLGDAAAALEALDQAVRLGPADPWSWAFRAKARAALGDQAGAEADFERALRRREQRLAVVLLWRGEWRHQRGLVAEARRDLEDSFHLEGKDPRVLAWLKRLGRPAGAS